MPVFGEWAIFPPPLYLLGLLFPQRALSREKLFAFFFSQAADLHEAFFFFDAPAFPFFDWSQRLPLFTLAMDPPGLS